MYGPLLECIPNVSEGRNLAVIDALTAAITSVEDVRLLHRDVGADANRTVFTFLGPPRAVIEAAKRLAVSVVEHIDLTNYSGTHPYIGALDVCPFVPLFGLDMKVAQEAAIEVAKYLGEELEVPAYLYEKSAIRPVYRSLAKVRKGGIEAARLRKSTRFVRDLRQNHLDPAMNLGPDFGPDGIHATAGASVVGARKLLVAYNINLTTSDVQTARAIAKAVRASGTGHRLPGVRAIGWYQEAFGNAQISINLTDVKKTGLAMIYETVRQEAQKHNCDVAGSEMIGLVPFAALVAAGKVYGGESISDHASAKLAIDRLGLTSQPMGPATKLRYPTDGDSHAGKYGDFDQVAELW
jgi:glutamate formiminotransferase